MNRTSFVLSIGTLCGFVLCGFCSGIACQSGLAQDSAIKPTSETQRAELITRLRSIIAHEIDQKQIPALSIALVEGDEIIWSEGFGTARSEARVPATGQTIYRVGSISKLLTDMAIMQQVAAGNLDLDRDIREYLPNFQPRVLVENSPPITLRHLMTHRAGLVRESPVGNYFDDTLPSLQATVESLSDTDLIYPTGTRTKYSNAGIAVVGEVLSKRLDKDFEAVIAEQLLGPLAMRDSFWTVSRPNDKLSEGWMWTHDGRRFMAPDFALGTLPAGNLYSSVEDLSRFMIAVMNEGAIDGKTILEPSLVETMLTPAVENEQTGFGIGFRLEPFEGCRSFGHGGAVYGFSTQIRGLPDQDLAVAAVANLDGANGVVLRLSDYALRALLAVQQGRPMPEYELTEAIPQERARAIAGAFRSQTSDAVIELDERAGRLMLREGALLSEIRQQAERWIVDDVVSFGNELTVVNVDELEWKGVRYSRLPEELPAACPEEWKGLIGEYGWDHNTLYILEDRGQLVALIEWFYFYPLTQITPDVYAFPDYGLYHGEQLIFERDAQGLATHVVAASVDFVRRELTADGTTFKIEPLRPASELRTEALAASPPEETSDFLASDLVEVTSLEPGIQLDIRYASDNNFMGTPFYTQARAFLQRPAAEALVRMHHKAAEYGLGVTIHDAYRPWYVTKMFYEGTPDELKIFVANPARGSRHNRGCAVDMTFHDLATKQPVPMVAGYDEFATRAYPHYPGGTSQQRWYRTLLRRMMEQENFTVYEFEWWHFDFADWQRYGIQNSTFEQLGN